MFEQQMMQQQEEENETMPDRRSLKQKSLAEKFTNSVHQNSPE